MTESDLLVIEARANAATPGEWVYDAPEIFRVEPLGKGQLPTAIVWECPNEGGGVSCDADGIFLAHARQDIPALVAEVRRQNAHIRRLEMLLEPERKWHPPFP